MEIFNIKLAIRTTLDWYSKVKRSGQRKYKKCPIELYQSLLRDISRRRCNTRGALYARTTDEHVERTSSARQSNVDPTM